MLRTPVMEGVGCRGFGDLVLGSVDERDRRGLDVNFRERQIRSIDLTKVRVNE